MAASYLTASILRGFFREPPAEFLREMLPEFPPEFMGGFFQEFMPGFIPGFIPGIANILALLSALYIWRFVLYLRDMFKTRELFESYTRQYEGAELQRLMLEDSDAMSGADARMSWIIRVYGVQLFVIGILTAACSALGIRLSLPFSLLLFLLYLNAVCIFALLKLFKTEHYFAGEGISAAAPERSRRVAAMLVFSLAAALPAALASAGRSILPLSLITGFFRWLFSLFERQPRPLEKAPFIPENLMGPENPGGMDLRGLLGEEESAPWPFWDYLQRLFIVLLVLGLVWFMLKPLFFRTAGTGPLPKRIAGIFKGWFAGFLRGISWFFSSLGRRDNSVGIGPAGREIRNMTEDILAAYSRAKRRGIRKGAALFARLILWGNENFHVSWKASLGPGEYCAALSQAVSRAGGEGEAEASGGKAPAILRCGELFEEILYSPRDPDPNLRREFEEALKLILGE
jgi:hypothetical protein